MRAFVALDFDDAVLDAAAALTTRLGPELSPQARRHPEGARAQTGLRGARWVDRSRLHVTLRFFAALDAETVAAVTALVPRFVGRLAIAIDGRSLLAFPDARRAHVLTVDVGNAALSELAADVDRALAEIGVPPEPRPFRAHLTLARFRASTDVRALALPADALVAGRAIALSFYESVTRREGPTYTPLARAPFVLG
jgi:2'-5' RNA ligase